MEKERLVIIGCGPAGLTAAIYALRAEKCYTNAKLHIIENGRHGFRGKADTFAIERLKEFAKD